MTESTDTTCTSTIDCSSCSRKTIILRTITWTLLLVTIALWIVNASAITAAVASLTFTLGIIASCLFLLFLAAQLMG